MLVLERKARREKRLWWSERARWERWRRAARA